MALRRRSLRWLVALGISTARAARLLQIPDIHGDIEVMKKALALVQPIAPSDKLVFTGDLVDRGPFPQECYELSERLAQDHEVTRLIGNHEWVNLLGVSEGSLFAPYVPKEDLASFGGWGQRMHAFSRDGDLGKLIRMGFDVIALEELPSDPRSRTLFVHAGISLRTMKRYGSVDAIKDAGKKMLLDDNLETELLDEILQTRHLAEANELRVCPEVDEVLQIAGAERLVVGHTPTVMVGGQVGKPLVRCDGRLLLTDVAMSRWMGGGMPSALTIETDDDTGRLARIFFRYGRGEELEVPISEALNEYLPEL
mmetsp:Transcript_16638/g.33779  ORF Transcript_16638/g.33779 Transcript_16638/m.33779 type:complete len:311 (+) Transcript_16638:91-1023(+)